MEESAHSEFENNYSQERDREIEDDIPTPSETFCSNCGKQLEETEAFCSRCGTEKTPIASKNARSNNPLVPRLKKAAPVAIGAVAAIFAIAACASALIGNKEPDFESLMNEYCEKPWADLGSDGSYLSIDTNPYDIDDGDSRYLFEADQAIQSVNEDLGFDESVYKEMSHTAAADGRHTATANHCTVSWTYHPDRGLEVTYKKSPSR